MMIPVHLKKLIKFLSVSALLSLFVFIIPAKAFASAWLNDKGASTFTTSLSYTSPYKSSSPSQAEDTLGNTSDYNIASKTGYMGIGGLLEYGLTSDITLIGEIQPYYYNDRITVSSTLNGGSTQFFSLRTNYYDITSNFGFKNKIYKDDYQVLSYQVLIHPGNFIINDKATYLRKKFAGQISLLYGYSFNIPFGTASRPEYENYIDLEMGYKGYPSAGKNEGILNASLGLKPFGKNPLIVVALYNTFNGYNYTKRPFNQGSIDFGLNALGLTPELADIARGDIALNLSQQANAPYHQASFQLGFSLDPSKTLYLKSFHNVIKGKPFTYNSYYVSLEYKF